jgi:hypothetical protein
MSASDGWRILWAERVNATQARGRADMEPLWLVVWRNPAILEVLDEETADGLVESLEEWLSEKYPYMAPAGLDPFVEELVEITGGEPGLLDQLPESVVSEFRQVVRRGTKRFRNGELTADCCGNSRPTSAKLNLGVVHGRSLPFQGWRRRGRVAVIHLRCRCSSPWDGPSWAAHASRACLSGRLRSPSLRIRSVSAWSQV